MEYLVFWMKLAHLSILAVQLSTPTGCPSERAAFANDPTVDRAVCMREADMQALLKKRDCSVMENRDNFANYICSKDET